MITVFHAFLYNLTEATREEVARILADEGGTHTQTWTWRGGEAAVLVHVGRLRTLTSASDGQSIVVVRRGLRRGKPMTVDAEGLAQPLRALTGRESRIGRRRGARRRHHWDPLARAARRAGKIWRTVHAR